MRPLVTNGATKDIRHFSRYIIMLKKFYTKISELKFIRTYGEQNVYQECLQSNPVSLSAKEVF